MNTKLELEAAVEPSDIIWENKATTSKQLMCRQMIVSLVILVLLIASMVEFRIMLRPKTADLLRYPPITNCKSINQ